MNNKMIEVELRAKVDTEIFKRLSDKKVSEYLEHDCYYTYENNIDKNWIVRVRQRNDSYFLTFKSKKQFGEGAWSEVDMAITSQNAENMKQFCLANDFYLDVEIKKVRKSYRFDDIEVNIDEIENLGVYIEAEVMTQSGNIESGKQRIMAFFDSLGISADQIIREGYVSLMRSKYGKSN